MPKYLGVARKLTGSTIVSLVFPFFPLLRELAYHTKLALNSRTRRDVDVRIELHFIFAGGLEHLGTHLRTCRGDKMYGIKHNRELEPLLRDNRTCVA